MDAKMAAYLRGMVDARQGAKERRAALCNLRLRALALIDTFAKKVRGGDEISVIYLKGED